MTDDIPSDLRAYRKRLGVTQAQLADRLGVHRVSIGKWETGVWPLPPSIVLACEALLARHERGEPMT